MAAAIGESVGIIMCGIGIAAVYFTVAVTWIEYGAAVRRIMNERI